jgi:hypothetical protein
MIDEVDILSIQCKISLSGPKSISFNKVRVRVKVTLYLAVYRQSVGIGGKPLETHDQYFFNRTLAVIVLM